MSLLKELPDKGATIAWSSVKSHPNLMALGTKDGGGGFDDYGGELEIHRFDFANYSDQGSTVLGKFKTQTRFASLAWSEMATKPTDFPLGLVAGGMSDGVVNVWDPAKLVANHPQPQMSNIHRHQGPVNSIQFNHHPESSHLLASGGADAEVYIMSLERPDTPNVFVPAPDNNAKHLGEVTKVAWNSQVAHILATSGQNGSCIVWDLRQKKPWCELKDAVRGRIADVAWNPDQGLHIVTASGDDNNPVLNLWDLRGNYTVPSATLRGHTQGILSIGWCKKDTSLIMSCGKDNRTLLWDLFKGEAVYELPSDAGQQAARPNDVFGAIGGASGRRYEISWSPNVPAVVSTCSFDRKVQVFSMASATSKTGRAPRWLARPVGSSFGFGGKLLSFSKDSRSLKVSKVVENPELVQASKNFEKAMASKDFREYCISKTEAAQIPYDKKVWKFMQVIFEKNAREQLLSHLGFNPESISALADKYAKDPNAGVTSPPRSLRKGIQALEGDDEKPAAASLPLDPAAAGALSPGGLQSIASSHDLFSPGSADSAKEVFGADMPAPSTEAAQATKDASDLPLPPTPAKEEEKSVDALAEGLAKTKVSGQIEPPPKSQDRDICAPPRDPAEDARAEEMIKRALLVGNFEAAVQCCLKNGQMADALVLASCGGADLWASTQAKYFEAETARRPFLDLVACIIKSELGHLVETNALPNWEETLAILSTYAKSDEFPVLCEALAGRLEKEASDVPSATLCYMCAVNIEKTIQVWLEELNAANLCLGRLNPMSLHEMVEKVSIFSQADPDTDLGANVAKAFATYAHQLAAQGELETAAKYVQTSDHPSAVLKDRLWHACDKLKSMQAPPFPFEQIQVNVSPNMGQPGYQSSAAATGATTTQQEQQQATAAVPDTSAQYQLPPGWQQLADQHGRIYYYNSVTGESQWEAPAMPQQQSQPQAASTPALPNPAMSHSQKASSSGSLQQQQPVSNLSYPGAAAQPAVVQPAAAAQPTLAAATPTPVPQPETSSPAPEAQPTQAASAQPAAAQPAAAQPEVPADMPADIAPIAAAFNNCVSQLSALPLSNMEKKQVAEVNKAIADLFQKLNSGQVAPEITHELNQIVNALTQRNFPTASAIQARLADQYWSEHKTWLKGTKFMIQLCSKKL